MIIGNQDFNSNFNKNDSAITWCHSCRLWRTTDDYKTIHGKYICYECADNLTENANQKGIKFEFVERRIGDSLTHSFILTDVYANYQDNHHFIKGYETTGCDLDKASTFDAMQQYVKNDGEWLCYYGSYKHPLEFISQAMDNKYVFEIQGNLIFSDFNDSRWTFHGNFTQVSNAFSYAIFDKQLIVEIAKLMKLAKWHQMYTSQIPELWHELAS